jgi:hypothetical protein
MTDNDKWWTVQECTLPTVQRPGRLAEFDDLFATALRGQERLSPTVLRWLLDPAAESVARDLTGRESQCCSFFTFTFSHRDGTLQLDIHTPSSRTSILDGLAERAAARIGS